MNKRDVLELKKRLDKKNCTFTKMSGCYVNSNKEMVLSFQQDFRDLKEEEYFKYLDLAKKVLSGTVGNSLLKLDFSNDAEATGGPQQVLLGIRESNLLNEDLLETFYKHVIDNFYYVGNYLILLFRDTYDIPAKTSDNFKTGESVEVYEYILCAICPVDLSKPALSYIPDEDRIGARIRDWVVGMPEIGFVFPCFDERSANIHSTLFYTKNTKEPHDEFMREVLGCGMKHTTNEKKQVFKSIVLKSSESDEKGEELFTTIQGGLNDILLNETVEETDASDGYQPVLTKEAILGLTDYIDIPVTVTEHIAKCWEEEFEDEEEAPEIKQIVDKKFVKEATHIETERSLVKENAALKQQLNVHEGINVDEESHEEDVILRVSKKKALEITTQVVDGQKYIMIPVEDEAKAFVNGKEFEE